MIERVSESEEIYLCIFKSSSTSQSREINQSKVTCLSVLKITFTIASSLILGVLHISRIKRKAYCSFIEPCFFLSILLNSSSKFCISCLFCYYLFPFMTYYKIIIIDHRFLILHVSNQYNNHNNFMKKGPLHIHMKAYRFFPTQKEIKSQTGKNGIRFIFYGQIEHDSFQLQMIEKFQKFLAQNGKEINRYLFTHQRILLFLQGNKYDPQATYNAIQNHLQFRKDFLPINYEKVKSLIVHLILDQDSGVIYPCGRDYNFRPILVFNIRKVNFDSVQQSILATSFVQEYVMRHMLLPGQVENWIVIYDLGRIGITQIPLEVIRKVSACMSNNYGGRLYKLFAVQAPTAIWFGWNIVSKFLDPVTAAKITISTELEQKSLFDFCDKSQVEAKYGGTQADRTTFWPFQIPQAVVDDSRLLSQQSYLKMIREGKLSRNKIHPFFSSTTQQNFD